MSEKLIGSCIFGQSGGPTAVINASAYGVIRAALDAEEITKVYGAAHGIRGVLDDKLYVMDEEDPAELKLLLNTPSSELGSCRYKIADPEKDDTDYKRILEIFKKYNVRYFFYNGVPRPSTMTSSAPTTAPASPALPSISPPPAWRSTRTPACMTAA